MTVSAIEVQARYAACRAYRLRMLQGEMSEEYIRPELVHAEAFTAAIDAAWRILCPESNPSARIATGTRLAAVGIANDAADIVMGAI